MAFITYNLPHQILTGLNPCVLFVALTIMLLLAGVILWLSLRLKEKRLRSFAILSLVVVLIVPPIIQSQRINTKDARQGIPRRYYQLPDSSEEQ